MDSQTKVTALVPAYQSAEFIQKTLDSLSVQTRDNFNVIISVDFSDDDTYEICRHYCSKDSHFSVIRQDERLGYVGNCNFLLDQADSDYVFFAFHDDILDARYLEKLCAVLDSRPEVVMTYSDVLLTKFDSDAQECWIFRELDGIKDSVKRGLSMLNRKGNNRGVFRLDEARKIQGLKTHEAGEFSTDWPWLFHMSLLGQFQRVPRLLCHKFYKKGSITRTWEFSKDQWYAVTEACMREIWISQLSNSEKTLLANHLSLKLSELKNKL